MMARRLARTGDEPLSMLTIAHLSDVHLGPLPRTRLWTLSPKQMAGYANWHRGRKHRHLAQVLELIVADIAATGADHVAVTGDLCNIGLKAEIAEGLKWLERLGPPDRVTVVPGNHDAYVRLPDSDGVARWAAYMSGASEHGVVRKGEPVPFPFVRRLGPVALVGLSSAVPTPMFRATGRLGSLQREGAAKVLRDLGREGLVRVVLIHHPPLPGHAHRARRLIDAGAFEEVLREAGAELVLHGHNHRASLAHAETVTGRLPVVGVASASVGQHRHDDRGSYNLYRIEPRKGGRPRITLTGRAVTEDLSRVETIDERVILE